MATRKTVFTTLLIFAVTLAMATKPRIYHNQTLDRNIRTIVSDQVFPLNGSGTLRFDYLGGDAPYMLVKVIHCDWNWKQSTVQEFEFIEEFNEFRLSDVEGASSAYIPYFHYFFRIPKVKMSGNYVLKVYDEDNPDRVYMYRRFSVYEEKVRVQARAGLAQLVQNRYSHQQLDFSVHYGAYPLQDPMMNVHVVLRQNNRWDHAIKDVKPSFVNEAEKELQYNFYGEESTFPALREYRQCAFGRQQFRIEEWQKTNHGMEIELRTDIDRSNLNYVDEPDRNGRFEIDSPYDADYSHVTFSLQTEKRDEGVFIFGQLSDWDLDPRFKMDYDSASGEYRKTVLLKNGEYDYSYAVDQGGEANEVIFQGSHSETRNIYEILIYYRRFGRYNDEIVGFKEVVR